MQSFCIMLFHVLARTNQNRTSVKNKDPSSRYRFQSISLLTGRNFATDEVEYQTFESVFVIFSYFIIIYKFGKQLQYFCIIMSHFSFYYFPTKQNNSFVQTAVATTNFFVFKFSNIIVQETQPRIRIFFGAYGWFALGFFCVYSIVAFREILLNAKRTPHENNIPTSSFWLMGATSLFLIEVQYWHFNIINFFFGGSIFTICRCFGSSFSGGFFVFFLF